MQLPDNLKLYKVQGFFVTEFYLLASSLEKAQREAQEALTFRVEECSVEEPELP